MSKKNHGGAHAERGHPRKGPRQRSEKSRKRIKPTKDLITNGKPMLKVIGKIDTVLAAEINSFFVAKGYETAPSSVEGDETTLNFTEPVTEPPVETPELTALVEEVKAVNEKIVTDVRAITEKIDAVLASQSDTESEAVKTLREANERFKAFLATLEAPVTPAE